MVAGSTTLNSGSALVVTTGNWLMTPMFQANYLEITLINEDKADWSTMMLQCFSATCRLGKFGVIFFKMSKE